MPFQYYKFWIYRKWQWNKILPLHRLLQNTTECYYNLRQLGLLHFTTACYYNLRRVCYYNSRHLLLHFTTGITIHDKCNYNSRQVLQFTTLLHFMTAHPCLHLSSKTADLNSSLVKRSVCTLLKATFLTQSFFSVFMSQPKITLCHDQIKFSRTKKTSNS